MIGRIAFMAALAVFAAFIIKRAIKKKTKKNCCD